MQTIDKALSLLDFFSEQKATIGLSEFARLSGYNKATARRFLVALEKHAFVEQDVTTRAYRQAGALPDLSALSYIARAITPPGRTRRFDARFFMAPAEALLTPEPTAGSGELDEIAWLPLEDARALDLPAITRFVLGELAERLSNPDRPLPFVRMVRGRHVVDHRV